MRRVNNTIEHGGMLRPSAGREDAGATDRPLILIRHTDGIRALIGSYLIRENVFVDAWVARTKRHLRVRTIGLSVRLPPDISEAFTREGGEDTRAPS